MTERGEHEEVLSPVLKVLGYLLERSKVSGGRLPKRKKAAASAVKNSNPGKRTQKDPSRLTTPRENPIRKLES